MSHNILFMLPFFVLRLQSTYSTGLLLYNMRICSLQGSMSVCLSHLDTFEKNLRNINQII